MERKIVAEGSFEGSRKNLRSNRDFKKIKDYYLYKIVKNIKIKKSR